MMLRKLQIVLAFSISTCVVQCENVTISNLTDNSDYESSVDYDEAGILDLYKVVPMVAIEPSPQLSGTETAETEFILDEPTTPIILIKPAVTARTPKPGIQVLTNDDEISPNHKLEVEELDPAGTAEFEETTVIPEVVSEVPDIPEDYINITGIQMRIKEMTEKLQIDTTGNYVEKIQVHQSLPNIAGAIAELGDEIDHLSKGRGRISKTEFDLQTQYLHLYQQMEKFNDTLNDIFKQKAEQKVELVTSLLKQGKMTEAAKEVSTMHEARMIPVIVRQFYEGKRENILILIDFTYQLSNPTQQLIAFHALHTQMKRYNHTDDPGVLPMHDEIVGIHALEEFPTLKHDAGVLLYDDFRDNLEKEVHAILTEWQNKMQKVEYDDIIEFASKSAIYSESLNNNMLRLLWLPNSFETNYEFLRALPDLSNRIAGYMYLNDVYKNHHRYDEMIKLGVTVREDIEKNLEFIDDYVLSECKRRFWSPVKKLIWSESCFIKNMYTGKYLFEYKNVNDREVETFNVETVRWNNDKLLGNDANKDLRWRFVASKELGKFEIQNMEYLHTLEVDDIVDENFKFWPRRLVRASGQSTESNQTKWTVILSDKDEKFSFKSGYGFLTAGRNNSSVFTDEKPRIAKISKNEDRMEFLQHHLWDIDCT